MKLMNLFQSTNIYLSTIFCLAFFITEVKEQLTEHNVVNLFNYVLIYLKCFGISFLFIECLSTVTQTETKIKPRESLSAYSSDLIHQRETPN